MQNITIRVNERTRSTLRSLAQARGESIQDAADKAVELLRRQRVLEDANAGYAALRDDPEAWEAEQQERAVHAGTLADGLEAY